jgi:hypothetical protein
MIKSKEGINEIVADSKLLINNSINDENIKQTVGQFGYTEPKLTEGQTLLGTVEALQQNQSKEYGEQYQAKSELNTKRKHTHGNYMDLITICRIALRDDLGAQQGLGLNQTRKASYSGWLAQALLFCNNLMSNPDYTLKLEQFGQSIEKIQAIKTAVLETQVLNEKYNSEKGEAQQATKDRDKKIDELNQWVSDYTKIVRIALKNSPQLLEKLGILVRS